MGFYIPPRADDREASTYQEKRYVQKKAGKVFIKKHSVPRLGLGGLCHRKRREESLRVNHIEKYLQK
jgi:hypothetical protein